MIKRFLPLAIVLALAVLLGFAVAAPDLLHHMFALAPDFGSALFAWGPAVLALQSQHSAAVKAMVDVNAKAEREGREFTSVEQAQFDKHKADAASLKVRIERAKQLEHEDAVVATTVRGIGDVTVRDIGSIRIVENIDGDPNRGFVSIGEYARAVAIADVHRRTGTGQVDQRIRDLKASAPTTSANEGSGADGGVLIPPGFGTNIFALSLAEDSLLPMTDVMPLDGNSMQIPKDETTPWGGNGLRAYWQAEATVGTQTKPVLGMMDLRLKKLLGLAPMSNELVNDAAALTSYLPDKLATSVRWKTNEAILFGSGAGIPIGALTALPNSQGAMVVVPKDSGQVTNTLSVTNLATMIARLPPGSYGRSVWLVNNDVIPALLTLTLGNWPVMVPLSGAEGAFQGAPTWKLLGRPVIVSQHASSFSSQGDVMLLDLSYYQSVTKAEGITTATSMHLYFDADAMAFRVTFRVDGQPKLTAPITPAKGTNKLSPFVVLGAR